MVFALVVSLFASTKRVRQGGYATLGTSVRQVHPRRDSGARRSTATAAMAERRQATCAPVSVVSLIAAPPVEKIIAAPTAPHRARECSVIDPEAAGEEDVRPATTKLTCRNDKATPPPPRPGPRGRSGRGPNGRPRLDAGRQRRETGQLRAPRRDAGSERGPELQWILGRWTHLRGAP